MIYAASPEKDRQLARASAFCSCLAAGMVVAPWFSTTTYTHGCCAAPSTSYWWLWQVVTSASTDSRLAVPLTVALILLVANLLVSILAIRCRRLCLAHITLATLTGYAIGIAYIGVMLGPGITKASIGLYVSGFALLMVLIFDITRLWDWTVLLDEDGA